MTKLIRMCSSLPTPHIPILQEEIAKVHGEAQTKVSQLDAHIDAFAEAIASN
jgi:hypothetical protein